jgi:hypothetical protein
MTDNIDGFSSAMGATFQFLQVKTSSYASVIRSISLAR